MEVLVKKEQLNELYDLYESLLTEKQKLFFNLYYQEDYSLNEIASLYDISRNAVYDHLKKVEEHLINYESKLKLLDLKKQREDLISNYLETKDIKFLIELRKLDE
jgi:uncharacterized protein